MEKRNAITIFDEDSVLTVLKPFSAEHNHMLFVIYEDTYGEITGVLTTIDDLKRRLNVDKSEFQEMLNLLL
jgi:Mg2+/Co2+ transporter CorC